MSAAGERALRGALGDGRGVAADPRATALFTGAFLDELAAGGVRYVVVAPGSRSTPLAVMAYEAQRRGIGLEVIVDVDERGAAFVALGLAKATGRPACVVCTSGTAVANLYPAVMEAESSRVPMLLLTGDRPPRLQGLGAPQTCDRLHAFGTHVAAFRQMPLPSADEPSLAFARQAAREALAAAGGDGAGEEACGAEGSEPSGERLGGAPGAPVHVNFPFEEPLMPDFTAEGLFCAGRASAGSAGSRGESQAAARAARQTIVWPRASADDLARRIGSLARRAAQGRTIVLAGEGAVRTRADARELIDWADAWGVPVLADPLSGLRGFTDRIVIDGYDNVFGRRSWPQPEMVVRFGRWPVSKRATQAVRASGAFEVVVDECETRDFNAMTGTFVQCAPRDFVRALRVACPESAAGDPSAGPVDRAFAEAWIAANEAEAARIALADGETLCLEGPVVRSVIDTMPDGGCLVVANSMAIRAVDTFYEKRDAQLRVLCNRGLNGIDGTVSTAVGAALAYGSATLLIGDLALLHDLNALALQREMLSRVDARGRSPRLAIVALNNNGGAIFDMLPQSSDDPYFERLFLTPQDVRFEAAARAFSVPHRAVRTMGLFREAHLRALETPGISIIEVPLPLRGVKERYGRYW